jgi:hypothetical protein
VFYASLAAANAAVAFKLRLVNFHVARILALHAASPLAPSPVLVASP